MSNVLLVQAASGLERLMHGSNEKNLKNSMVAQISAAVYYQSHVFSKLVTSKKIHDLFRNTIFSQIEKDFGEYMDAQARSKPRSLHHVYEWKRTGNSNYRLFKLKVVGQEDFSFRLNYEFLPSKSSVPNSFKNRRHVFFSKAEIMERGDGLTISPRNAERLVFESDGMTVFMPKGQSVFVRRPGGSSVKNSFGLQYSRFFSSQLVNESIKKSGFQKIFGATASKALSLPVDIKKVKYTFSPNTVKAQAAASVESAGFIING